MTAYYYRGQANEAWEMIPTILRVESGIKLKSKEITRYYERAKGLAIFEEIEKDIVLIGKMQHYGFKTHLLDITRSVDIAIFFACNDSGNMDEPGEIIIIPTKRWNHRSEEGKLLHISCGDSKTAQMRVKQLCCGDDCKDKDEIIMDYKVTKTTEKTGNLRIKNQQGAFIIPSKSKTEKIRTVKIDSKLKIQLLCELAMKDIHSCSVYPDRDEVLQELNKFHLNCAKESEKCFDKIFEGIARNCGYPEHKVSFDKRTNEEIERLLLFGVYDLPKLKREKKLDEKVFLTYCASFETQMNQLEILKSEIEKNEATMRS